MNLHEELKSVHIELEELEARYVGHTPAQNATLQKLKAIDLIYQSRKKVLETKLAYIKAQMEECSLEQMKQDYIYLDCLNDAMLDSL